uniref:Prolyl 4-hydroxylase 9 n=1 Tax=Meloidogyne hapla TaxID=6305 RepID=A0A1I8BA67_MELHA
MSRVRSEYSSRDNGSPSAFQMEKREQSNNWFKWFAIIISILCVIFMIATVVLENITLENSNDTSPNASELENIITDGDAGPLSVDGIEVSKQRKNRRNSSSNSVPQPLKWPPPSGSLHLVWSYFKRCQTIDAREVAPIKSNSVMYQRDPRESVIGYRSIAVPGELHGYWTAFTKFGSSRISWKRIFEPAIKLAREGFPVSSNLAMVLQQKESDINEDEDMRSAA